MRLVDLLCTTRDRVPCATAAIDGESRISYSELASTVSEVAEYLRELGVGPGDVVAISSLNSASYYAALLAINWSGAIIAPVNLRLSPAEVAAQLRWSKPKLAFADDAGVELIEKGAQLAGTNLRVLALEEQGLSALPRNSNSFATTSVGFPFPMDDNDVAFLKYTGGTTGTPKGVMLTNTNCSAWAFSAQAELAAKPSDVFLMASPMYHVGGLNITASALIAGSAVSFLPKFDAVAWIERVAEHRVTHAGLAPTMIQLALRHAELLELDLSSLRSFSYGGSSMPANVLAELMKTLPRVRLLQAYGQTESAGTGTLLGGDDHLSTIDRLQSVGKAAPGVEVIARRPDGKQCSVGEPGLVWIRSAGTMKGYWKDAGSTSRTLVDGWLDTGDIGYFDAEGYLFISDRQRDMIVTGGENVYSIEVERIIQQILAVKECAIIGVPDTTWGERVHAIVRLKEGMQLSEQELIAHCREHIAGYKCPKTVHFSGEDLPRSPIGKVQKFLLKQAAL